MSNRGDGDQGWRECPVCLGKSGGDGDLECPACKGLGEITAEQHRYLLRGGGELAPLGDSLGSVINRIVRGEEDRGGVLPLEGSAPAVVDYRCPLCQDRGFFYQNLPETHLDYGRRRDCVCQRSLLTDRLERHWRRCGFDSRYLNARIETHPIAAERANPALIAELLNPTDAVTPLGGVAGWQRSWMLWGPVGHGKTGLAAGYAWRFLFVAGGESVCFRTVPELLAELRASYSPRERNDGTDGAGGKPATESDLIHRYTTAGLLVLDDLGTEQLKIRDGGGSWAMDRLFMIVNKRHGQQLPMVVTSNLSPAELGRRMGDVMGQRILSRIAESCAGTNHIVEVNHRNLRYG